MTFKVAENSDIKVLALVGSLRAASINRQIAELAAAVAPDGVTVTLFEGLGELPFYNEDIDPATNIDVQVRRPRWPRCAPPRPTRMPRWWSPRNTTAAFRRSSRTRSTGCLARSATAR